jgi:hypothetical protein
MPDDIAMLERLHRVLEPRGKLVVRVPARPWARDAETPDGSGVRRYDAESLRDALEEAAFHAVRVRHWNLVGVLAALRAGNRGQAAAAAPADAAPRRWWDSPLDLWYGAVERRVGFPLGVSLVAVATPEFEKARVRRAFQRPTLGRGHRAPMGAAPMTRTAPGVFR